MFNIEFLHKIRDFELQQIAKCFMPKANILELGGGTGYQSKILSHMGFNVVSIDIETSNYAEHKVFPVQVYDGNTFPCANKSMDIVFSSNVLEHVQDLKQLHIESRRVLKEGGYCIHVMPTGSWRFWSNIAHYVQMFCRIGYALLKIFNFRYMAVHNTILQFKKILSILKTDIKVTRHGEVGNALTEIYTFSHFYWLNHFRKMGLVVEQAKPVRLFYTGYLVFGKFIPISLRKALSYFLGSASYLYKVSFPPQH